MDMDSTMLERFLWLNNDFMYYDWLKLHQDSDSALCCAIVHSHKFALLKNLCNGIFSTEVFNFGSDMSFLQCTSHAQRMILLLPFALG